MEFPESVISQADGKSIFKVFSFSSDNASTRAGKWKDNDDVVRVAQCTIPDIEVAHQMLETHLRKFGLQSWIESSSNANHSHNKSKSGDWECVDEYTYYICEWDVETQSVYMVVVWSKNLFVQNMQR